jgi:hypothetical protein
MIRKNENGLARRQADMGMGERLLALVPNAARGTDIFRMARSNQ